jgi:hypothetical protein
MNGKIGLEEHFAIEDTLQDSAGFVPGDYWRELRSTATTRATPHSGLQPNAWMPRSTCTRATRCRPTRESTPVTRG